MKDQNFLAIDLELNSKQDGTKPRIIEVGIAIGSLNSEILTHNWYLDPQEPVTPFITDLTGITDKIIQEKAVSHEVLAQELGAFLELHKVYVNPVVWGGGGYGNDATELKDEFRERDIEFHHFGHRVIDVKTVFTYYQLVRDKNPKTGLKGALGVNKLKFEGIPHRAADDAKNTLKLFFHYMKREMEIQQAIQTLKDAF